MTSVNSLVRLAKPRLSASDPDCSAQGCQKIDLPDPSLLDVGDTLKLSLRLGAAVALVELVTLEADLVGNQTERLLPGQAARLAAEARRLADLAAKLAVRAVVRTVDVVPVDAWEVLGVVAVLQGAGSPADLVGEQLWLEGALAGCCVESPKARTQS